MQIDIHLLAGGFSACGDGALMTHWTQDPQLAPPDLSDDYLEQHLDARMRKLLSDPVWLHENYECKSITPFVQLALGDFCEAGKLMLDEIRESARKAATDELLDEYSKMVLKNWTGTKWRTRA